jgi:hypothetical protein
MMMSKEYPKPVTLVVHRLYPFLYCHSPVCLVSRLADYHNQFLTHWILVASSRGEVAEFRGLV